MSPAAAVRAALADPTHPAAHPAAATRRSRLHVVEAPRLPRSPLPFAAACLAVLAAGLVSLLVLNISLSSGSYEVHRLEARAAELAEQREALSGRLSARAAPQALFEGATALGMVVNPSPAFIRLSDGAVLGVPEPAAAPPPPPEPAPEPTSANGTEPATPPASASSG